MVVMGGLLHYEYCDCAHASSTALCCCPALFSCPGNTHHTWHAPEDHIAGKHCPSTPFTQDEPHTPCRPDSDLERDS